MSVPTRFFSRNSRACRKLLALGVRTNDSLTSAGYPARKFPHRFFFFIPEVWHNLCHTNLKFGKVLCDTYIPGRHDCEIYSENIVVLGCHFSRDDFLGIFRFFDFNRLPSKLAMNLVVPSLSLMCIFLPAFWPSSAQSLVLSACEA